METRKDIRSLSLPDLEAFFLARGEKKYRAGQVYEWLWKKSAGSFAEMTSLSKELREMLEGAFVLRPVRVATVQKSADGTVKCAFRLHGGELIEGVLIPMGSRMTACVSSQVGCSLTCAFCATGALPRKRNLDAGEIYDQVVLLGNMAMEHHGLPLTNVVYMGMGEPLLNYRNVVESVDRITAVTGLNMAPRRITVSTAGIAKMIARLADDKARCNLALSLHAADDEKRSAIMPINEQNGLDALAGAVQYYHRQTRRGVTLEYILFKGFNDSTADARNLLRFARKAPCKINLIEYNAVDGAAFEKPDEETVRAFKAWLENKGLVVNVRRSRGRDIDAACGQLANKAAASLDA
jgi:23S rRNA (adenine2503-C2)-methyltransferase